MEVVVSTTKVGSSQWLGKSSEKHAEVVEDPGMMWSRSDTVMSPDSRI